MSIAVIAPLMLAAAAPLPVPPGVAPIDSRWEEVSRVQDRDCALAVIGNGRFYLISATGLGANAPARFLLTNGDMKPIDWQVRTGSTGRFARYYLPFRWHRRGGVVSVTVSSAGCSLASTFEWRRADVTLR